MSKKIKDELESLVLDCVLRMEMIPVAHVETYNPDQETPSNAREVVQITGAQMDQLRQAKWLIYFALVEYDDLLHEIGILKDVEGNAENVH